MATQTINRAKAIIYDTFMSLVGAKIITIEILTDAKLKKTNNPFAMPVMKFNKLNGMVNFHYDRNVLAQLEREGKSPEDFKQGESWHEAVLDDNGRLTPFCKHKNTGELYLRFRRLATIGEPFFIDNNGKNLTKEEVEPFIPVKKSYGNQGTDKAIEIMTIKFENVVSVVIDGVKHDFVAKKIKI
jgi:hypothetical protein